MSIDDNERGIVDYKCKIITVLDETNLNLFEKRKFYELWFLNSRISWDLNDHDKGQ